MLKFNKLVSAFIAVFMFLMATIQVVRAQTPKYSGKVTLQGLQQNVEVFFDKFGIPHIYGKSLEDAYYAFGYVHAQERISQFEFFRRIGTGTFAEVSQDPTAPGSDVTVRTVGITATARLTADAFKRSPNTKFKRSLNAYLAGVNAYLATLTPDNRPKDLFPTPSKYTIEDLFATLINFQFGFPSLGIYSDVLTTQLKDALDNPAYFDDLSVLTGKPVNRSFPKRSSRPRFKHRFGKSHKPMGKKLFKTLTDITKKYEYGFKNSNGWAVSGKRTNTGKPFLSSDAHIALSKPDLFYEAQIVYPGQDLYGLFFPFSNLCTVGHNQNISWGLTVMLNDDVDLYREKINPNNPSQVMFGGKWTNLVIRKETIRILQADGTLKDSTFDVKITPHGPIINDVQGQITGEDPISLFYVGYQFPERIVEVFFDISNAKNIRQFKRGISKHIAPGYNLQYADKRGNIAWFAAGKLLKRPDHVNSKVILDGASGRDEPLGYFPFSKNPRSINPPSGFIYSANNQIGKVDGKLYPGYYVAGTRAKRIKKIFRGQRKFSSQDLQKLFNENTSKVFKKLSRELLEVIKNNPVLNKSANHQKVATILSNWQGEHTLDTQGPIVFYQLYFQLLKSIFEDEVGADVFQVFFQGGTPLYDVIDRSFIDIFNSKNSIWYDNVTTSNQQESRAEVFAQAFDNTVQKLVETGVLANTWGEVHTQTYFSFPALFAAPEEFLNFSLGPFPFSGGINVLNKTELDLLAVGTLGNYAVAKTSGPGNRNLFDFSDIKKKSFGIIPTGQSGVPTSPFYQDQAPLYNNGQLRPMLSDRTDIKKQSSRLLLKKPRPVAPNVGDISGPLSACDGDLAISYSVEPVANADIYVWILPVGVAQSGTGKTGRVFTFDAELEVDFGSNFSGGAITVAAKSVRLGMGNTSTLNIEKCVNARTTNTLSQELNNKKATLFPNPITGSSTINIQLEGYENNTSAVVEIIDVKGRVNRQVTGKLQSGKITLNTEALSLGLNILKIKIKSEIFSFQVIKNK